MSLTIASPGAVSLVAATKSPRSTARARATARHALALLPYAASLGGTAAGAWLALRRPGLPRAAGLGAAGASLTMGLARWQLARFFTEQARYRVEGHAGGLELRRYPSAIRAETVVRPMPWADALNDGFHRLAGYIFGRNDRGARIAMTAPVLGTLGRATAEKPGASEILAMAAPVRAHLHPASSAEIRSRTFAFAMPAGGSIDSFPRPRDVRVRLREEPERRVAVLRFSGAYGGSIPEGRRGELVRRVRAAGLVPVGEVIFAGYDPPSTLSWLRRNEVMVEVRGPGS
jgi:hypothetical protein